MNQTLAAAATAAGLLQISQANHHQDQLLPMAIPPESSVMDNNSMFLMRPNLSLNNTHELLLSPNNVVVDDPIIFNNPWSATGEGGGGGGSAYSSATALLQKAAEMGSKISNVNSNIAPSNSILQLRGMNSSCNSVHQEISSTLYNSMGNLEVVYRHDHDIKPMKLESAAKGAQSQRMTNFITTAAAAHNYDPTSTVFTHSSSSSTNSGGNQLLLINGGGEKLTLDFLGVEPATSSSSAAAGQSNKRRPIGGDTLIGTLEHYSKAHQNLHHLHSEW